MKNTIKKIIQDIGKNISSEEQKKLKKALEILMKMKPNIKPDKKFKKNLKQKLETMITLNSEQKPSFLTFLIPVTSAVFVFGFLYYSFDDAFFSQKPGNIDVLRENTLIDDEIQTIENIFLEEVEKVEKEQEIMQEKIESTPVRISTSEEPLLKKQIPIAPSETKKVESRKETIPEKKSIDTSGNIEDTQIIDILGEGEDIEDIPESSLQMRGVGGFGADMFFDDVVEESEPVWTPSIGEFEEQCQSFSGSLSDTDESKTCKGENFECSWEDYTNQNCNWEKKN